MRVYLFCCLLISSVVLCAQRVPHPIVMSDLLLSPYVTDIEKDNDGFMWIATTEGLCRYDGSSVVTFQHRDDDPHGLVHNFINEMLFDSIRNILWLGTDNGLSVLNLEDYQFTNPGITDPVHHGQDVQIRALCLDRHHQLWFSVSGTGLATYIDQEDTVIVFPIEGPVPSPMQLTNLSVIMDIASDPTDAQILWLGTAGGLVRFDIPEARFVPYFFLHPNLESELYRNQIRTVLALDNGTVCAAPWSEGMMQHTLDRSVTEPQFVEPGTYRIFQGTAAAPPLFLIDDQRVCYNTVSSCIMNLATMQLTDCITMRNTLGKWYTMRIILIDGQDRKWGASEYGVHLFDPLSEQIYNYQFPARDYRYYINSRILEADDGRVLIAYENAEGAFVFDQKTEMFQSLLPASQAYLPDSIFNAAGFIRRPNGEIWLLERHKVYRVSIESGSLIPLDFPLDTLPHFWSSILQDEDGALWLGSGISGLVYYQPSTGEIRTYREELESGETPTSAWLTYLFEDRYRNIWIRKEWGYAVYLRNSDTILNFNTYRNQKYRITNFVEDDNENIWTGYPGGLLMMSSASPEKGVIEAIGQEQGLSNLNVQSLACDAGGHLWMMTHEGLQVFSQEARICRTYDDKDGMIMFDERFNRNPARLCNITRLSDGRMAYAPRAGFSFFHPDSLRQNTEIPKVYIRSIRAADSLIASDLFEPLEQLVLPYGSNNNITIECSAIAYSQSKDIRFEYHLGDADWRPMENRHVQFSHLAPGEYDFYFRASNSAGLSSEQLKYIFTIRPPWWRTWWFYSMCALISVVAVWYVIRFRETRLERIHSKEREVQVLMAGLESRALRNQMNPHFLFNIFNNIQELILTGNTEKAYTYTTKFSKLLRMILDNARKDEITIDQEGVFLGLYLELEALRFDDVFDYHMSIEEGLEMIHIPVFVVQPLVENAIRHGLLPKAGNKELHVEFYTNDEDIICAVTDNGVGLDGTLDTQPKGRDHALQLIRHRLRLIDGASLTVENLPGGAGAVSRVSIPMKN